MNKDFTFCVNEITLSQTVNLYLLNIFIRMPFYFVSHMWNVIDRSEHSLAFCVYIHVFMGSYFTWNLHFQNDIDAILWFFEEMSLYTESTKLEVWNHELGHFRLRYSILVLIYFRNKIYRTSYFLYFENLQVSTFYYKFGKYTK